MCKAPGYAQGKTGVQAQYVISLMKIRNPNPFPMGKKFGFFLYGGRYRTRTYDLPHVKRML